MPRERKATAFFLPPGRDREGPRTAPVLPAQLLEEAGKAGSCLGLRFSLIVTNCRRPGAGARAAVGSGRPLESLLPSSARTKGWSCVPAWKQSDGAPRSVLREASQEALRALPLSAPCSHTGSQGRWSPQRQRPSADAGPTRGWAEDRQEDGWAGQWGQARSRLAQGVRPNSSQMLLNQAEEGEPRSPGRHSLGRVGSCAVPTRPVAPGPAFLQPRSPSGQSTPGPPVALGWAGRGAGRGLAGCRGTLPLYLHFAKHFICLLGVG